MNEFRSETMRTSLHSIINTTEHLPVEIFIIDNGNNRDDSIFFLDLSISKKSITYIRNPNNMGFGFARNQGVDLSCGKYLVFTDNDIEYKSGWLDKSIEILEAFPDKKIAITPLRTDRQHRNNNHWVGELPYKDVKYLLNLRAGSNSWVIRRKDFDIVGKFRHHEIAGTHWTNEFVHKGYLMATMEQEPLAEDIGFKRGYDRKPIEIAKHFANGDKIIINN